MQQSTILAALITALSSLLLSGCVLQGVPVGLSAEQAKKIETGTLDENLSVAREMEIKWTQCRDTAEKYSFWSNASLIPLAAGGAAAAIYKGSKDLLAGIGLAAGTIVGANAFIGSNTIASGYQSGMNGMQCITNGLGVYGSGGTKLADAAMLDHDTGALEAQISQASSVLDASDKLDMSTPAAIAERTANPGVVAALQTNEKALSQAITDGQNASASARAELRKFTTVAAYAKDRITDVNNIVAQKIKPGTVNYASLLSSIQSFATGAGTPKAAPPSGAVTPPTPPHRPPRLPAPAPPPPPSTPIADAANNSKLAADSLAAGTKKVTTETSDFDLTNEENNITTCLKNL